MAVPIAYSVKNLTARKGTTLLAAAGIGLVVVIFSAVLMLAHGFRKTLVSTGSLDNAIVLRKGATSELVSSIDRDQAAILKTQPEVAVGSDGAPVAASELIVIISAPKRSNGETSNIVVRGVTPDSLNMRPVKLVEGRTWTPGLSELVAGSLIASKFKGCGLGETVHLGGRDWTVVGLFDAGETGFESELWGDAEQVMAAVRRPTYSSVTVKLKDPAGLDTLKERIEKDPRFNAQVQGEREFYDKQSTYIALFIQILGIFVTSVFSLAAILAAMLTMFATISSRTAEIGTLRALGYPRRSILLAFVLESTLVGIVGGVVGILPAFALQYLSFSTTNWTSFSEVAWKFSLSGEIVAASMLFAASMGFLGGLLPAWRAARIPIVDALREG
ncbi:MAG: ABC transporter permease [Acidobacteria bacterium]|nr:ABC transporter permease [Acidobacteriota bacterium]